MGAGGDVEEVGVDFVWEAGSWLVGCSGGLKCGGSLADRRRGSVTPRVVRGLVGSVERAMVINGWVVVVVTMEVQLFAGNPT